MGTKLDYAINVLETCSSNRSTYRVDDWEWDCFKSTSSGRISAMDGGHENQNMESIRRTMHMHEDIFKHQVQELHRLYNVQKMLMKEIINQSQFANQRQSLTQTTYNFHIPKLRDDRPATTSSYAEENSRMTRGFNLDRPVAEENKSTPSQSQVGPSSFMPGFDEESQVELSLSIGGCLSNKKSSNNNEELGRNDGKELDSSASFKSERGSSPNTPMSSSASATFNQDSKQQHWLFGGLSINRT
ncbi:hypothetical protein ACFE04_011253 [Oxalis oulophora]